MATNLQTVRAVAQRFQGLGGYKTVLFGDSMTEMNNTVYTASAASYSPSTGELRITQSGHALPVGASLSVFNRTYAGTSAALFTQVASVISSSQYTVQIGANLAEVPSGTLSGTTYVRSNLSGSSQSWFTWLNALLGQRFKVVFNGAQSGDRVEQCLERLQADCLAYQPDVVVMQSPGVNNLTLDVLTFTNDQEAIYTDLALLYDRILASGASLLLANITPVYTGEARAQLRIMQAVQSVNAFIRNYAQTHKGVYLFDAYRIIVDPTNATGLARQYYLNSTDNIHYVGTGAYAVAAAFATGVGAAFPALPSSLPVSTVQSRANSLLTTPTAVASNGVVTFTSTTAYVEQGMELFLRGATGAYTNLNTRLIVTSVTASNTFTVLANVPDGTVTGTLLISTSRQLFPDPLLQTATGGTITGAGLSGTAAGQLRLTDGAGGGTITAVASVVAAASGYGNAQRVVISAAATNDRLQFGFKNSVGTVENQMTAGRTYVFEADVRISSTSWADTPLSELYFNLALVGNNGESWTTWSMNQYSADAAVPYTADTVLHLRTEPITIPYFVAPPSSAQFTLYFRHQAGITGAATLTIDLAQIACWDVTADYSVG